MLIKKEKTLKEKNLKIQKIKFQISNLKNMVGNF